MLGRPENLKIPGYVNLTILLNPQALVLSSFVNTLNLFIFLLAERRRSLSQKKERKIVSHMYFNGGFFRQEARRL
jgi:hypothetical protein